MIDSPERSDVGAVPEAASLPAFTYSMMFALSEDLGSVLLLQKPSTHRNPLFRNRWTAPGGHIERSETPRESIVREMEEETNLRIQSSEPRFILRFACNCDPLEAEHDVVVYAAILPLWALKSARGDETEPVGVFSVRCLPHTLWYIEWLLKLTIARMTQPLGRPETTQQRNGRIQHAHSIQQEA